MMQTHRFRVVIADRDPAARGRAAANLSSAAHFDVVAQCSDGMEAIQSIRRHRPDLVLLDVELPEMDGFAVVASIQRELPPSDVPVIVFLTSETGCALRAFDCRAVDYVLKPFADERLQQALQRATSLLLQRQIDDIQSRLRGLLRVLDEQRSTGETPDSAEQPDLLQRIGVRIGDRWVVIPTCDIEWIEGAGVYAKVMVGGNSHLIRTSLSELEKRLDPEQFVRIHRSTIVSISRVAEVRTHGHGEYVLALHDGTELKVSRSYSDRVRESIAKLG